LPPELERVLRHCLEKRPEERFQSARDLAFDLESLLHGSGSASGMAGTPTGPQHRGIAVAGATIVLLALVAGAWLMGRRSVAVPAPMPVKVRPLTFSGEDFQPAVSPDGRLVAFTSTRDGTSQIWLLDL